ncbi:MAG: purine/pyrimidine permease [Eubacterium sp.]|nr:purine/pyrimidine permease [Eubacterium sp.]
MAKGKKKRRRAKNPNVVVENIYQLDGRVPLGRAIPYGLQHVLAMFVANLTPITIIAAAAVPTIDGKQLGYLIQNAMFIAGIATLLQLYPIWRIGSRLPIVMGVSFTFVTALSTIAANNGYPVMLGTVLAGGLLEGLLGLTVRKISRFIKPIVPAVVVCGIGLSLFTVGVRSFGGGYTEDYGSPKNLVVATFTLLVSLLWMALAKGTYRSLAILIGLILGYILSICLGMVDLSGIMDGGFISFPHFLIFVPEFKLGPILSIFVIFLVSATETIGDTSAMAIGGLGRPVKDEEVSGSLVVDGFASSLSSLFGCPPVTSFSQNVGLIAMTKVVNRFTIMTGAGILVIAGLFPPVGHFFASIPQPVLGGCTILMFGQILLAGMKMIADCGFTQKNITIASLALALAVGTTAASEADIWNHFPNIVQDIFKTNVVAVVFVVAMLLSYILPEKMGEN